MTFSSLNSVLQLICAVYVTIVFDNILFRRFWTQDYYDILQNKLKSYKLPISIGLYSRLTEQIKLKNTIFEDKIRRRGGIFLFNTIILLCSIGTYYPTDELLTFPFFVLFIMSYVLYISSFFVPFRWRWLLPLFILELAIYGYFIIKNPIYINLEGYAYKYRAIILVLSIIPIMIQIIQSGIYSTGMSNYVEEKLKFVASDYYKVKDAILSQDNTKIPQSYSSVFVETAFIKDKKDAHLTYINRKLISEVIGIFESIPLKSLVKAYCKSSSYKISIDLKQLSDESISVNQATEILESENNKN